LTDSFGVGALPQAKHPLSESEPEHVDLGTLFLKPGISSHFSIRGGKVPYPEHFFRWSVKELLQVHVEFPQLVQDALSPLNIP